jgi:alpha-mannosidase
LQNKNHGSGGVAITRVEGEEVDRRMAQAGSNVFEVYLKPVTAQQNVAVTVEWNGATQTQAIQLKPVRRMLIYALPHSHHDLGYTDLQANVEEKQIRNITRGIELARKTAGYPEGSPFVWNLEVLWGADLYMRRNSEAAKAELIDAVQKGWIGINGSYANELTGLCRPEELLQLFHYSGQLGKTCNVKVDSAMMSDVPGFSWGTVTAMAQAGIRYFSAAPNYFDRIGNFMVTWQDKPFWWISPSGKEKVLFWVPWTGYALSHVMKLGKDLVAKYQDRMDDVGYPYDISYIRWSGHGDNAEPDPDLSDWIRDWNQKYEWPRFAIASTSTAFSAILDPSSYSPPSYDAAWRDVLLYSEHTWGAWNSVSDSENSFVKQQWDVKQAFAVDAAKASKQLLDSSLGEPSTDTDATTLEVHNSTSWNRTEIAYLSRESAAAGDHVTDTSGHALPSQRLSSGELAIRTSDVPAFGAARYSLSHRTPHKHGNPVSFKNNTLDNGILQVRIDASTGDIVELKLRGENQNLANIQGTPRVNQFLLMAGKDLDHLQSSGPAGITVEDDGPLVATIRIESSAPTCKSLVRRVRLAAGMDYLELTNTIDKLPAALNPHPGVGGPGDEFAQHGSKESIQFAFPFAVPNGKMSMDIPLGNMQPEVDQLPGSCKNWLPVGRWIDVSNQDLGVTWVTRDAPLTEIGSISATMLGSQRDPNIWRKHIEPTQTFYSWVMNNHWGTNYRAYQEGPVMFGYAIRPHGRHDAAAASRFAIGLSQPLIVKPAASHTNLLTPLLKIEPADVLAMTLKPSEDRSAWIVRLFGASGEPRTVKLDWGAATSVKSSVKSWIGNLAEEKLEPADDPVHVDGWGLVTLRVEKSS